MKNKFVWYELMTTDIAAAKAFYGSVVGWGANDMPDMNYSVFVVGDHGSGVAGLMPLPKEAGPTPSWIGYIDVEDVDLYAEKVVAAGGQIHRSAADIPHVGRFCVMVDPQGAPFILFTPIPPAVMPPMPEPGSAGTPGWHELMATDGTAAFDFYSSIFGWTKAGEHDMGPMGIYQLFATGGGFPAGGMMTTPAGAPGPFWNYYFNVDGINSAVERINSAGGTVTSGPHPVPGDMWVLQGLDPQGARFALVSTKA